MDTSKVEAITNWPTPRTSEVQSFHGLAQFYRKFIRGFSEICAPMLDTIKGGVKTKFQWNKEANKGFELLKQKVATQLVLILPSFDNLFTTECDASNIEVGVVLSQDNRPVAFFSEKINDAKNKYSSYDLELYALFQDLRKWRHYLLPKEFVVYTDNQALSFLNSQDKLSHRHVKWVEYLQSNTFSIKNKKGQCNKVADALSRRLLTVQEVQIQSIGVECFKDLYPNDEDFVAIYKVCQEFQNHFHCEYAKFTLQNGLLFRGGQLCVPKGSMRENLIQEKHNGCLSGHFGLNKTLELVQCFYYWPRMQRDIRRYVEQCMVCQKEKGTSTNAGLYQPLPIPTRP